MRLAFEDFVLDGDSRELTRRGATVALEPQVFDLVAFLVENRHRVVSRDDLLAAVWQGRIVSESAITSRINAARRALGDTGGAQRLIRTIYGRGLRFTGEVAEQQAPAEERAETEFSIAVVPFTHPSGERQLGSLAAGVTENLIAALSASYEVRVIVAGAGIDLTRPKTDVRHVARRLGARFLLHGSVRSSGGRVRIAASVVGGATGDCVWSDRYDCPRDDAFVVQDDIARRVAIEVCANLTTGDHARVAGDGGRSLEAWVLFAEGQREWRRFTRASNARAGALFKRAHEADPTWPTPLAWLAAFYREVGLRRWGGEPRARFEHAVEIAKQALALGPDDANAHRHLATALISVGQVDEGLAYSEKAITLAPNDFFTVGAHGYNLANAGESKRALAYYARAHAAWPTRFGPSMANEGYVLHLAGERESALATLKDSVERCDISDAHVRLAAAYFEAGREHEARDTVATVLAREPDATIDEYTGNLPFADQRQQAWYRDLLRGAGLPEAF